jgi:hypothetical protein
MLDDVLAEDGCAANVNLGFLLTPERLTSRDSPLESLQFFDRRLTAADHNRPYSVGNIGSKYIVLWIRSQVKNQKIIRA